MSYTHRAETKAGKRVFVVIREGGGSVPPPCEFEDEKGAIERAAILNKKLVLEDWLSRTKDMQRMVEQEAENERKYRASTVIAAFGDEAILHVGRGVYKIGPLLDRKPAQEAEQDSPEPEEDKGPSIF